MPAVTRDDTRQRILDEALDLFAAQGVEGTPLQQIADRLNVTKAALYYHFKSKDDLIAALIEPVFDDLETWLDEVEENRPSAALRAVRLEQYLDFLLERRRILGFITRDLAVLAHPMVTRRAAPIQIRLDALLLGGDLEPADRIRATVMLTGMQGAIAAHGTEDPVLLRETILGAGQAMLRHARTRSRAGVAPPRRTA